MTPSRSTGEGRLLWALQGESGLSLSCDMEQRGASIELRVRIGGQIVWSELFEGPDVEQQAAKRANAWKVDLVVRGCTESI